VFAPETLREGKRSRGLTPEPQRLN
jgi:hypothetical protein